jgi:hypothetical protein
LLHRVRFALTPNNPRPPKLDGEIEIDETYCGGKPRRGTGKHKAGCGTKKTPVVSAILQGLSQNRSFSGVGLRENIDPNRPVRISYQKPLKRVKEVRDRLGVESNKEVGLKTFDYYYEFELGK